MRARLVSYLAWVGLIALLSLAGLSAKPAEAGDLLTLTPTASPTPTIAPPILLEPANNAVLPQPVAPQTWTFRWSALRGACKCSIAIWQPDTSLYVGEQNIAPPREYVFYYTTASPLPPNSLQSWYWKVWVTCPNGSNESETRAFSVGPTPTPAAANRLLFPLVRNMGHQ